MSSAPASPTYFIGVDGGGTKTAIAVVSDSGAVLSAVTVGSTNPNSVGDEEASKTMHEGIKAALGKINGTERKGGAAHGAGARWLSLHGG